MPHPALAKRSAAELEQTLQQLFGSQARTEALAGSDFMGRRIHGVNLQKPPSAPSQAQFMVTLLDHFSIISFPDQGTDTFRLSYLERLANHFGAPIPHPTNYSNYLEHKKTGVPLWSCSRWSVKPPVCATKRFPNDIKCGRCPQSGGFPVVSNLPGSGLNQQEQFNCSLHWHTDIEFEPEPLSTSMFYVQRAPLTRRSDTGNWIKDVPPGEGFYH